jgi:outer membrane protein TolC
MRYSWTARLVVLLAMTPLGCQATHYECAKDSLPELVSDRPQRAPQTVRASAQLLFSANPPRAGEQGIDLEEALALAGAGNPTIALAREAIQASRAEQLHAQALLLPTLSAGASYDWHQGNLESGQGVIFAVERQSAYVGNGAGAIGAGTVVFPGVWITAPLAEAIFEPRAARFLVAGRQYDAQATQNAVLLEVATRYFALVGAEARLKALETSEVDIGKIVTITAAFAEEKQGRMADALRARTEALLVHAAAERMQEDVAVASAELARLLNLDPSVRLRASVEPIPLVELVDPRRSLEELVEIALTNRPEVAARSADMAVVQTRLRKEQIRPWLPVLSAGFSAGGFGGGGSQADSHFGHYSGRTDVDAGAYWSLPNFGFGILAVQRRLEAHVGQANAERLNTIDAIRQEVADAFTLVAVRRQEIDIAGRRTQTAQRSFELELTRAKNLPKDALAIEALDSARLLNAARQDYLSALIGYNQAQLQFFVSLGQSPTGPN